MEILQYLGIDVAKESLVICLRRSGCKDIEQAIDNTEEGLTQILELLGDRVQSTSVKLEATSRYHRLAARMLSEAGAQLEVMNPLKARSLAVGLGIIDKDDKTDARVLAEAAKRLAHNKTEIKSRAYEDIRDLSRLIDTLTQANADNKKRLQQLPKDGVAYRVMAAAISSIASQIKLAKSEWIKLVRQDEEVNRRYTLALSIPDVGHETARVVACELPSRLEDYSDTQLCAYAGVVPRKQQSGQQKTKTSIGKRGNSRLRTGIFMAATHSIFHSKRNADLYSRLVTTGRVHKQAVIAVLHKVLRQILTVLRRNSPWVTHPI